MTTGPLATVRSSSVSVVVPASGRLADLLGGRTRSEVFTAEESRLLAGRPGLTGWAGRYAAKLAVAELVGVTDLAAVEILPDRSACTESLCTRTHPPAVRLQADRGEHPPAYDVHVSITHTRLLAVALAVLVRRDRTVPGDH